MTNVYQDGNHHQRRLQRTEAIKMYASPILLLPQSIIHNSSYGTSPLRLIQLVVPKEDLSTLLHLYTSQLKASTIISLGLMATLGACSSYALQAFQSTDCSGTGQTPTTGGAVCSSRITGVMALGSWQFSTTSDPQLDIYLSTDCSGDPISMMDGGCLKNPGPYTSSEVI